MFTPMPCRKIKDAPGHERIELDRRSKEKGRTLPILGMYTKEYSMPVIEVISHRYSMLDRKEEISVHCYDT
jgi:hypothetical protein